MPKEVRYIKERPRKWPGKKLWFSVYWIPNAKELHETSLMKAFVGIVTDGDKIVFTHREEGVRNVHVAVNPGSHSGYHEDGLKYDWHALNRCIQRCKSYCREV